MSAFDNCTPKQEHLFRTPEPGSGAQTRNRSLLVLSAVVAVAACLWVLVLTPPAARAWEVDSYSRGSCNRDTSDPLGVYFYGPRSGVSNTADQIELHVGWTDTDGWFQSFQRLTFYFQSRSNIICKSNDTERANHFGYQNTRFHIRLWDLPSYEKGTLGTPHHEDWVGSCGSHGNHAVDENGSPDGSGFDRGRRAVAGDFRDDGHRVHQEYWGNTRNFRQCDGQNAGSNGVGVDIRIGHTRG
jgi:hypothetical protein